jgi:hypothetical protein
VFDPIGTLEAFESVKPRDVFLLRSCDYRESFHGSLCKLTTGAALPPHECDFLRFAASTSSAKYALRVCLSSAQLFVVDLLLVAVELFIHSAANVQFMFPSSATSPMLVEP